MAEGNHQIMRYITPVIEQLDRAVLELATDHAINSRLALILIDNALELIVHRRCTDAVELDRQLHREIWKLSPKQRRMAGGRSFEDKLAVLVVLGDISDGERRFIAICHDYRNELYHVGLRHDGVVRAIAGQYFKLCLELFERLRPMSLCVSSVYKLSEIGTKYLGVQPYGIGFSSIPTAANKLLCALPTVPDIVHCLSRSADLAIDQIEESFNFLVDDNFSESRKDEILDCVQFRAEFSRMLEKEGIDTPYYDPETAGQTSEILTGLKKSWRPRYRKLPTMAWRKRAAEIGLLADFIAALDRYQALRNDMQYLEDAIGEAAAELDAAIQNEVDRARGK